MRFSPILILLGLSLSLAACKKAGENTGQPSDTDTQISVNFDDGGDTASSTARETTASDNGTGSSSVSGDGAGSNITVNADGLKMNVRIPQFDINPISGKSKGLYPGSKITGLNVNSDSVEGGGSSKVILRFTSPASPEKVADWFAAKFRKDGALAALSGNTLTGTTEDGDPFILTLRPDGQQTRGVMNITQ